MKLSVKSRTNDYDIIIENDALKKVGDYLDLDRKVMIVTDDGVPDEYIDIVAAKCKESFVSSFVPGENSKTMETMVQLQSNILKNDFTRKDCVLAIGGGVVGDMAGFVAATYMRGIDFYNIPTTLLSQVDSSIGGKTAVNLDGVKNIVGAFYDPRCVIIDPLTLGTLSERQVKSGLVEAIKMAATCNDKLFSYIEGNSFDTLDFSKVIEESLKIKRDVVQEDPNEAGLRKVLNFGHTIGHAFEACSNGELFHGECVGLGMLYMCSESVRERIYAALEKYGLPVSVDYDVDQIMEVLMHDKKKSKNKVSCVYVEKIGEFEFVEYTEEKIRQIL